MPEIKVEKLTGKDVRDLREAEIISRREARVAAGFPAYENEDKLVRQFADALYKEFEPDITEKEFRATILKVWHRLEGTGQPQLPLEDETEPGPERTVDTASGVVATGSDQKTPAEVQADMDKEDNALRERQAQQPEPFDPATLAEEAVNHPSRRGPRGGKPVARPSGEAA